MAKSATNDSTSRGTRLQAGTGQVAATIVVGMVLVLKQCGNSLRKGYHAADYGHVNPAFQRPCVVILDSPALESIAYCKMLRDIILNYEKRKSRVKTLLLPPLV